MGGAVNREDIIRMATKAGWQMPVEWDDTDGFSRRLERFAALAAEWGAKQEREACAKVVESRKMGANELMDAVRDMEAAAIRKRGEVKP